jgi:hypothetical protein
LAGTRRVPSSEPADGKVAGPRRCAGRPTRRVPWLFFLLFALLGGAFYFGGAPDLNSLANCEVNPLNAATSNTPPRFATRKIRDIEVGIWVLADNPELEDDEDEYGPIDPAQWRRITLRMHKPDGGTLDIDFLRPLQWLEAHNACVGGSILLQLGELGIDGLAEVRSITTCPPLPNRPSQNHRLVTGKFTHSAANVIDLHIAGLAEPIGTTANHPFWSTDRQEFVQAGSLQIGEHVLSLDGTLAPVIHLASRPGVEPVYNLETETEHVYYVSNLGILVHNAGDQYLGNQRGSYWASNRRVFPTSRTTMSPERVRGKGRGGRTKWNRPDDLNLKAEQKQWMEKRAKELMDDQGLPPDMAREIIEGQIAQQDRSPGSPYLKGMLDSLFGSGS